MSKLIEEHIYYLKTCPMTDNRLIISSCINCQYYLRAVDKHDEIFAGSPEHERIVCTRNNPARGSLIPV